MLRAPRPPGFCSRNHVSLSSPSRTAKCINVSRGPPSADSRQDEDREEKVKTQSKRTKGWFRSTPLPPSPGEHAIKPQHTARTILSWPSRISSQRQNKARKKGEAKSTIGDSPTKEEPFLCSDLIQTSRVTAHIWEGRKGGRQKKFRSACSLATWGSGTKGNSCWGLDGCIKKCNYFKKKYHPERSWLVKH